MPEFKPVEKETSVEICLETDDFQQVSSMKQEAL